MKRIVVIEFDDETGNVDIKTDTNTAVCESLKRLVEGIGFVSLYWKHLSTANNYRLIINVLRI